MQAPLSEAALIDRIAEYVWRKNARRGGPEVLLGKSLGRIVGYAWKCDEPALLVRHIRAQGVIRPDERKAFVNAGRLLRSDLPEAGFWPSSG